MDLDRVLLQRLPDLRLCLDARNEVSIELSGRRHIFGPHALRLLQIFSQPVRATDALNTLKSELAGTQDWILALRTVQQLAEAGILVSENSEKRSSSASFDQASLHIAMLNDRQRTQAFSSALKKTVKPGDVVADIGTGTGVLAMAAVQAGARKVYAIEAGDIREQALAVFKDNGAAEQVVMMPGWSTQVELPEPVDVLVGEVLGNDPFGEDIAATFHDACRRFLKPGGQIIPAQVQLWGTVVEVPAATVVLHQFEPETIALWEQAYGMKFTALLPRSTGSPTFTVSPKNAAGWRTLCEPVLLQQTNFVSGRETTFPELLEVPVTDDGKANGVLIHFTASLCDGIEISTAPQAATGDCHWRNVVKLLADPIPVKAGQAIRLRSSGGYQSFRAERS